jgi:hypothetical protein
VGQQTGPACRSPLVLQCSLSFSGDIWYAGSPLNFQCSFSLSFSPAEAENQEKERKKKKKKNVVSLSSILGSREILFSAACVRERANFILCCVGVRERALGTVGSFFFLCVCVRERGSTGEVWVELRRLLQQTLGWAPAYSPANLGWASTGSAAAGERGRGGKMKRGDLWMMGINLVFSSYFLNMQQIA